MADCPVLQKEWYVSAEAPALLQWLLWDLELLLLLLQHHLSGG
jgi:hypothetical protein